MDYLQQSVQNRIIVLFIAAAVDLMIGDPHWLWHPVQGVGSLISFFEKILRRILAVPPRWEAPENTEAAEAGKDQEKQEEKRVKQEKKEKQGVDPSPTERSFHTRERIAGALMVLLVLAVSTGLIFILQTACGRIHPWLRLLFEGVLCGHLLALRSLGEAGYSVRDPLLRGDIEGARRAVSMIVGRDTERLDQEGIAKAAVETVAENTSDGVTAPLFYMILLGGIGGIFYKAVNTMDSMTGYRNARYMYFGTAAARLDDVMNFIPARLTAFFMILACYLPGKDSASVDGKTIRIPDGAAACRIWRRDRLKSPSPNSAQTESVCAGALHLRLLGDTWYFGEVHHKAEIGDGGRSVEAEDITRSVRLMNRTAFLMFAAGILILVLTGLIQ